MSDDPLNDSASLSIAMHGEHAPAPTAKRTAALTLAALGVVFGDIGTSPLYALRETLLATGGSVPSQTVIFGSLSLIFWSLLTIVGLKYVLLIMRADNDGEGGVLALASLAHRAPGIGRRTKNAIGFAALIGLALFFGDGVITPAISVLSAVEGLTVDNPSLQHLVLPLTVGILLGLFAWQSRGTAKIGRIFGVVMLLWFTVLALLGIIAIAKMPGILAALSPHYAFVLFATEPWTAFVGLGAVVLAVTGCEALYGDMGHFGRKPIRIAFCFVLPALVLNYFGQGAALVGRAGQGPHRLLFHRAVVVSLPAGGAGHHGRRHRQPGGDLRRLFGDAPGGTARPPAAHGNPPHLDDRIRPDLRAARERDAVHRRHPHRAHLQDLRRARLGLRHRRHRRHADRHFQRLHRRGQAVEMGQMGDRPVRRAGAGRHRFPSPPTR